MTPVTAGKVKYGVWGLIGGAIIAMILGFAWGGWTTARTTQQMGEEAVLATRAAICVAQFMKDPNHQEHLQALGKLVATSALPSLKKGAGIKCPGKTRRATGSPAPAPTGLTC